MAVLDWVVLNADVAVAGKSTVTMILEDGHLEGRDGLARMVGDLMADLMRKAEVEAATRDCECLPMCVDARDFLEAVQRPTGDQGQEEAEEAVARGKAKLVVEPVLRGCQDCLRSSHTVVSWK